MKIYKLAALLAAIAAVSSLSATTLHLTIVEPSNGRGSEKPIEERRIEMPLLPDGKESAMSLITEQAFPRTNAATGVTTLVPHWFGRKITAVRVTDKRVLVDYTFRSLLSVATSPDGFVSEPVFAEQHFQSVVSDGEESTVGDGANRQKLSFRITN